MGNIEVVNTAIEDYKKKGCNIVGNLVLTREPEYMTPILSVVQLKIKVEDGDVYPIAGNKYGISSAGIRKFRIAGQVKFRGNPKVGFDPNKHTTVRAFVIAYRIDIDGTVQEQSGSKTFDLVVREEEVRMKYTKMWEEDKYGKFKGKSEADKHLFVEKNTKEVMLPKRKFVEDICVTGAESRAIIKLLGLKSAYTMEELQKPFVFITMRPETDWLDLPLKRTIMAGWNATRFDMYPSGYRDDCRAIPDRAYESFDCSVEEDLALEQAGKEAADIEQSQESLITHEPTPVPKSVSVGFINFPRKTREQVVQKLMERTGKKVEKPVSDLSSEDLVKLYDQLAA
jgi:hypothetical protein